METAIAASLHGVNKRYGRIRALDGVDLELRRGETLALLGPNGAGKTTAIRVLLGVSRPDAGSATLFGRSPRSARNRARAGAMLQVSGVPATLTPAELVALFSSYYPSPLPYDEVAARAGLERFAHRRFGDLSGGQQRRTAYALAICGDPDLLVLDEPTSALDVESRHALWADIRRAVARGTSVLLTTHDLIEAEALGDRIAVLLGGRIVADEPTETIKARAGRRVVRCTTALEDVQLAALAGVDDVRRSDRSVRLSTRSVDDVVRALYAHDPSCAVLEIADASLEDAFLSLLRQPEEIAS